MNIKNLAIIAAVGVGALALVGCTRTVVRHSDGTTVTTTQSTVVKTKHGPPPHAPAHGYRHKHGSTVLVYEKSLSLYVVSGYEGHYYHDKKYYRQYKGGWQYASSMDGKWKKVKTKKLPRGLRTSQHAKAKGHHKHK